MEPHELFDDRFPHATFHDVLIRKVSLDYVALRATFDCHVCVGDPNGENEKEREKRYSGLLTYTGLCFCAIDSPDPAYPYMKEKGLWVTDIGQISDGEHPGRNLKIIMKKHIGATAHWFFVNDWNAFIYIVADKAEFIWNDV